MRYLPSFLLATAIAFLSGCSTIGQNAPGVENFAQVSPDLYRGAQPTAEGIEMLASRHIKTVVNLRDTDEIDPHEAELVQKAGMTYISLPQDASKSTPADAERFLDILAKAPRPIFVHCHAGRDRTGLVVAAYRIRLQQWTAEAAIKELKSYGHYWALFPKIRSVVTTLAQTTPANALAQAGAKAAEKVSTLTDAAAKN